MKKEFLNEILDFAISREQEAVEFYQDLRNNDKFKNKTEMLKELEEMERGHIRVIESIKKHDIEEIKVPEQIENLKISDYLVVESTGSEATYQDILILAMKREEMSLKLYTNLADIFGEDDEKVRKLFQKLASEEAKHKHYFEEIYDEEILTSN